MVKVTCNLYQLGFNLHKLKSVIFLEPRREGLGLGYSIFTMRKVSMDGILGFFLEQRSS